MPQNLVALLPRAARSSRPSAARPCARRRRSGSAPPAAPDQKGQDLRQAIRCEQQEDATARAAAAMLPRERVKKSVSAIAGSRRRREGAQRAGAGAGRSEAQRDAIAISAAKAIPVVERIGQPFPAVGDEVRGLVGLREPGRMQTRKQSDAVTGRCRPQPRRSAGRFLWPRVRTASAKIADDRLTTRARSAEVRSSALGPGQAERGPEGEGASRPSALQARPPSRPRAARADRDRGEQATTRRRSRPGRGRAGRSRRPSVPR